MTFSYQPMLNLDLFKDFILRNYLILILFPSIYLTTLNFPLLDQQILWSMFSFMVEVWTNLNHYYFPITHHLMVKEVWRPTFYCFIKGIPSLLQIYSKVSSCPYFELMSYLKRSWLESHITLASELHEN